MLFYCGYSVVSYKTSHDTDVEHGFFFLSIEDIGGLRIMSSGKGNCDLGSSK